MSQMDLDRLARRLADGGVTRRGALKAVALAAVTAGLRAIGLRAPNVYADDGPPDAPAATLKIYLPTVQRACTEASRCGSRKYCDEKLGCLCIQTTEGDLRCGQLPSCNVKLCTKSSDCADVAPGAFCDTPLSGCCTSPPNTLSRCLLPCPRCAIELQCGTSCCTEGQSCRNGQQCITPELCAADPITPASFAAAQTALAGGATTISLSPNGCQSYQRTVTGGVLTQEKMLLGGFLVLLTNYSTNGVNEILADADQDGFNESQTYIYYAANSTRMTSRQFNRYDPRTRKLLWRRNETRTNDTTVHVTVDEWDTVGVQISHEEFDNSLLYAFPDSGLSVQSLPGLADGIQAACSAEDQQLLEERMGHALQVGADCFRNRKHRNATELTQFRFSPSVVYVCDPNFGAVAQATDGDFPRGPITITVNPSKFKAPQSSSLLPGESVSDFQSRVMFHEVSHFMVGEHSPRTEYYSQFDRTRACERLCFDPNANQCHCQTCLGDKTCNNGCSALPACSSSIQQCGNRCCVGPCDGSTCCPSGRICSKKANEAAVCCPSGEECINLAGGSSSCCPSGQICRAPNAGAGEEGKEICCQPGDTCGTDLAGNPACVTPKIVCPACAATGRPIQCFPANQAAACQSACPGTLACPVSCRPANPGECP